MRFHGRIGLLALGALALVLPASASAKTATSHRLDLDKQQQRITLPGYSTQEYSLSCPNGDIAADGMWRIDEVGPFNPQLADPDELQAFGPGGWHLGQAVSVRAAYPSSASTYTFRFRNRVSGDARLKISVTCLGSQTAAASERHALVTRKLAGDTRDRQDYGDFPGGFTDPSQYGCGPGEVFVSPGYEIREGEAYLFASLPGLPDGVGLPLNRWTYGFHVDGQPDIRVFGRCLSLNTARANGHEHKLYAYLETDAQPVSWGNDVWERRISCGDHQKGLVGGFTVFEPGGSFHDPKRWWLGMDPRIAARAYTTWGPDGGTSSLVCVNDRTSRPIHS